MGGRGHGKKGGTGKKIGNGGGEGREGRREGEDGKIRPPSPTSPPMPPTSGHHPRQRTDFGLCLWGPE